MKKPADPLTKGIVKKPREGLITRARFEHELKEKFQLLFERHGVEYENWKHLAISLAVKYVPGFQLIEKAGRPRNSDSAWSGELTEKLVSDVNTLRKQNSKLSENAACVLLKKSNPAIYAKKTVNAMRSKYRSEMKKLVDE
jgi:hypothetical protein